MSHNKGECLIFDTKRDYSDIYTTLTWVVKRRQEKRNKNQYTFSNIYGYTICDQHINMYKKDRIEK